MKNIALFLFVLLIAFGSCNTDAERKPVGENRFADMANEKDFEVRKERWKELIHFSDTSVDWQKVNEANFSLISEKLIQRRLVKEGLREVDSFAGATFAGKWLERGSNNQAGNVREVDYVSSTDDLYAISDGGMLWKSNTNNSKWEVLTSDEVFSPTVIKAFDMNEKTRILLAKNKVLWYSDNDGENWTKATGIDGFNNYGSAIDLEKLNDVDGTIVYLYNSYNSITGSYSNEIAYSKDNGESFTKVKTLLSNNDRFASLTKPHESDVAFVLDRANKLYKFYDDTIVEVSSNTGMSGFYTCNLVSSNTGDEIVMYALVDDQELYSSLDSGKTFNYTSTLPVPAWEVGVQVAVDDPTKVFFGEVELYRSNDSGLSFNKVADWYEYYNDVEWKIHADIMAISSFKKEDGTSFEVIPNHGGVSLSYDNLQTTRNIGMFGLNVGQFYDVITDPTDNNFIYGGTQDQGFLRANNAVSSTGVLPFEQVISGDYGHLQMSNNGEGLWIQYPGAWFSYYSDPKYGYEDASYDLGGNDMPNYDWIVPTAPSADASDNFIYVGGGNINGGGGSYLIKLEFSGNDIIHYQYDFDFNEASGANISAIDASEADDGVLYVATDNGRFFYSNDEGLSWGQTNSFSGSTGHWLYGSDILSSADSTGLVFLAGSGYSNSPIYKSIDGGQNFISIAGDLPETLIHELAFNADESLIFAATDAGPYVYVVDKGIWYDLFDENVPLQEYYSVEYVAGLDLVRFGTWGRGIWDLKLNPEINSVSKLDLFEFEVYPNPSSGTFKINSPSKTKVSIVSINGVVVYSKLFAPGLSVINIAENVSPGVYFFRATDEGGREVSKKIMIK